MLAYFKQIRDDYEQKLVSVKGQRKDLAGKEELSVKFSPKRPHGLAVARRPDAGAEPGASGGLEYAVEAVEAESQAEEKGVEAEWLIDKVESDRFSPEVLAAAQAGEEDYTIVFFRAPPSNSDALVKLGLADEPPKAIFSGVTERPKGAAAAEAEAAAKESDEDESEEEEEEEEEEGEGKIDAAAELAKHYKVDAGEDDEEEEEDDEDEEEEAAEGDEEDEGEEDEDGEDEDEGEEEDEEEPAEAQGDDDAEDAAGTAASKVEAEGGEDLPAEAAQDDSALAETNEVVEPEPPEDGGEAKAKKQKKAKKKEPKAKKQKKAAAAVAAPSAEEKPEAAPPSPAHAGEVSVTDATETKPAAKASAKGKAAKSEQEGIVCTKTLDFGVAVRSAICLNKEVWCADWKGAVTVRERDDASKVKAEIPTNRYIWSMCHIEPGVLWMGQESQGISLFDCKKKEYKLSLTGGHTGGVYCLALDEALGDEDNGGFPVRRGWSGSNDFTIRQWWIETWKGKDKVPAHVKASPGKYTIVDLDKQYFVAITLGIHMHGHTNGVRALLRIGPQLWSAGDDGDIRIWSCAEGDCLEVVSEAHKGSVLKLAIVRSFVWSCGADGLIKEWQFGGDKVRCVRQLAPPGFEKSVYAIVPVGGAVWSCGHHPSIRVLSQAKMEPMDEYDAHTPFVSNLLAVDRIETRILWSTSIGDKKLKVWRHTMRGNLPNMDELRAANGLYEKDAQDGAQKLEKLLNNISQLEAMLDMAGQEYQNHLDDLAQRLAEEQAAVGDLEERRRFLEAEMEGLRRLFEEAGLGHLLEDPEALRGFLDLKRLFDEAGLGHLLTDPESLKKFLAMGQVLKDLGLDRFLNDPEGLREFLKRAAEIQDILKSMGLEGAWHDPAKLRSMLDAYLQLKKMLEDYGLGDAIKDPSKLAELLSRYDALQKAFEAHGYRDMFEDPTYTLNGFLKNYNKIREEFKNVDLEYLMDSPAAMREFLTANAAHAEQLKEMQSLRDKIALLEQLLDKAQKDFAAAKAEADEFAKWKEICPSLEELKKMKEEAGQFRNLKKIKKAQDKELEEMRKLLEDKERERAEALERERMMALKYKELDIFKLDIIARELKAVDNEFSYIGKITKALQIDAGKLKNHDERDQITPHGHHIIELSKDLRAHIHDVINKCLSETQKFHIGVALDDYMAAGELKDGGKMAGYVVEEVDRPDYGSSKAAQLRQNDELRREQQQHSGQQEASRKQTLPKIDGRRSPAGH